MPLLVYLALPTRAYYWDGLAFAIAIEHGYPLRGLLHPNHLLYMPFGRLLWSVAQGLGLHTRALFLLQRVNSMLAFASVILMYRLLRTTPVERGTAIAGALAMAFSATWWKYSTDCDAYIPAIFFLLGAWLLLKRGRWFPAALALAAAMLFHELSILILPAALLCAAPKRRVHFAAVVLGPVVAAYAWAYRIVQGAWALAGFPSWVVSHSQDASFSFSPARDVGMSLLGTLRLFFGGKPAAMVPGVLTGSLVVAAALAAVALGVLVRSEGRPRFAPPPRPLVAWAAVYGLFLLVWMPQNTFYRLFYLPPLVLLGAHLTWPSRTQEIARAAVMLLFSVNFALLLYPDSRVDRNPPLACALRFQPEWPAGTPILFHRFHPDLWTISYFNPQAAWIGFERADFVELDQDLAYARSQRAPLWLEATAYDLLRETEAGRAWLAAHPQTRPALIFRDARREFRFYAVAGPR